MSLARQPDPRRGRSEEAPGDVWVEPPVVAPVILQRGLHCLTGRVVVAAHPFVEPENRFVGAVADRSDEMVLYPQGTEAEFFGLLRDGAHLNSRAPSPITRHAHPDAECHVPPRWLTQ